MTDDTAPTLSRRIGDALADALQAHGDGRMVLKHLVIIESLNTEGERTVSVFMNEDARAWDIMGLAEWAKGAATITQQAELMGRHDD